MLDFSIPPAIRKDTYSLYCRTNIAPSVRDRHMILLPSAPEGSSVCFSIADVLGLLHLEISRKTVIQHAAIILPHLLDACTQDLGITPYTNPLSSIGTTSYVHLTRYRPTHVSMFHGVQRASVHCVTLGALVYLKRCVRFGSHVRGPAN